MATHDPVEPGLGPVPEANTPGHHAEVDQDKPTGPPPRPRSVVEAERSAAAAAAAASEAAGATESATATEFAAATESAHEPESASELAAAAGFDAVPSGSDHGAADAPASSSSSAGAPETGSETGSDAASGDGADDAPRRWPFAAGSVFGFVTRLAFVDERWAYVEIAGGTLTARFGLWVLSTPLSNVRDVEVTGPYSPWKVLGPPHVSIVDRGLTFATTTERGACITFHEPVAAIDPFGWLRHPGLTVTVADPESLGAALRR